MPSVIELLSLSIFKKVALSDCDSHCEISSIPIMTNVLVSLLLHPLVPDCDSNVREQQVGFLPGQGCPDQILTFCPSVETRPTQHRPTVVLFSYLNDAFDPSVPTALFGALQRSGRPEKSVDLLRAWYLHIYGHVMVYGDLLN